MSENTVVDPSGFVGAPVYSQEMLAEVVARKGFHAFQEMSLPPALASSGPSVLCIKHFTGFLTMRQGSGEPLLSLPELDRWQRAILSIHDYRHEYLAQTAENAVFIDRTSDALQAIVAAWIDTTPRLKHRITVSRLPNAGLASIESHKVTGGPDIDALTIFLQAYLAADRLADDIRAALGQVTVPKTQAAVNSGSGAVAAHTSRPASRWRQHALAFSR